MSYLGLIGETFFDRQLEATDWRVENNKLAPSQSSLSFQVRVNLLMNRILGGAERLSAHVVFSISLLGLH